MAIKTAPQGSIIRMECNTDLEEPVTYEWRKQDDVLPREINPYNVRRWNKLQQVIPHTFYSPQKLIEINDVSSRHAGTYICSASNGKAHIDIPTIVVVTGIVPYFAQAPSSFVALPPLPDSFIQFNFEISFKPESSNGAFSQIHNKNKLAQFM